MVDGLAFGVKHRVRLRARSIMQQPRRLGCVGSVRTLVDLQREEELANRRAADAEDLTAVELHLDRRLAVLGGEAMQSDEATARLEPL